VVWAARDNPTEQTGPVRRSPVTRPTPEVEPPTRPAARRPPAPWETLAAGGDPARPGPPPIYAPDPGPPAPAARRPPAPWETLAADGDPARPGPPPIYAPDPGPPAPAADNPAAPHEPVAPAPAPTPAPAPAPTPAPAPGPAPGPPASPPRRSLIAADYRPDDEDGDDGAAPTSPPGAPAGRAHHGPPGTTDPVAEPIGDPTAEPTGEPTAEQEALWAFTRRITALREESESRAGAPSGRHPALPGWATGQAPPPPPPPPPVAPARRAASRGGVVAGLVALLAVALFVLVVLRWPDRGASDGPLAGLDGPIARSLVADRFLSVATWVENLATVLVIGGVSFRLYVSRPVLTGRGTSERLLFAASLAGIAACLVSFPLRALVVSGEGIGALGDPDVLGVVFTSRFGDAACVRILGLVLFGLIVARPPQGWGRRVFVVGSQGSLVGFWSISRVTLERVACVAAGLVALASFSFVGHPQASEPRGFLLASQAVHVLAASVWFGGGVLLALEIVRQRRSGTARATAETVERFSTLAGVSVGLVMISGIVLAHSQLASLASLWETGYGRALVAKLAFVGLVAAVGGYNHSVLVPAIAGDDDPTAWRRLGWTCAAEGTIIAAGVLVMTAAMTSGGF
ncbi:MAG TPA: CopD family protein, partial [Acidimicrobiales bacterium]|nr:CopD family protein [Acidimicrobiales bacterium]